MAPALSGNTSADRRRRGLRRPDGAQGRILERAGGAIFYTMLNRMMTTPLPRNAITARLMTRRYVWALVQHMDREICLTGLWVITGFDQRPIPVVKGHREGSTYSFRARISAVVNAVTSFSNRPLIYIFYLGAFVVTTRRSPRRPSRSGR